MPKIIVLRAIVADGVNTTVLFSGALTKDNRFSRVSVTILLLVTAELYIPRPTFAPLDTIKSAMYSYMPSGFIYVVAALSKYPIIILTLSIF